MPQVLTTNARVLCPHGGLGRSIATDPKWMVNGGAVLLDGDVGVISVLPCFFIPPCAGYRLESMKLNASQVDGRHVMLVTDFVQSVTGFPLLVTETHQTFDNSTPAPLPIGSPPATRPELSETDQPVVIATPSVLAFSKAAPVPLAMTFSLQSQFPRRWLLNILNKPDAKHSDITRGIALNIEVKPEGDSWPTPVLAVTVNLMSAFMATLSNGDHFFVLTAVNVRGKSGHAQVRLNVS